MRIRRRSLQFTRDGKYFVALTLGIGFAAINTGNNLLYLVLGLLLALIVGSGVLSEISLASLEVTRSIPDRIYATRPFLMGINLKNSKRRFPSFSIEVEDLLTGESLEKKCYFLKVPSGRTQHTSYRNTFDRRGLYRFTGFRISTKFPFALFRKSRQVACANDATIFPAVYPLLPPTGYSAETGQQMVGKLDRQGEFHGLRDYTDGDDPRDIHWRKSARTGQMVIRQHEEQVGRRIAIFLDNQQLGQAPSKDDIAHQEQAVSQAASLATHYIKAGYIVRLVTRTTGVGPGTDEPHLTEILRTLALLEFTTEARPYAAPARWAGECIFVGPSGTTTARPARAA